MIGGEANNFFNLIHILTMKRIFLAVIAMLLLFIVGCQKDDDALASPSQNNVSPSTSNATTEIRSDGRFEISPENFFNPIYIRETFQLPGERIVASEKIVTTIEELSRSQYASTMTQQIANFYGLPCWSCAEVSPRYDEFTITPIVSSSAQVTALLIAKLDTNPVNFELIDREVMNSYFDGGNARHLYIKDLFDIFDGQLELRGSGENSATQRSGSCKQSGTSTWCICPGTGQGCGMTLYYDNGEVERIVCHDCDGFPPTVGDTNKDGGPMPEKVNWLSTLGGGSGSGGYVTINGVNIQVNVIPNWEDLINNWGLDMTDFEETNSEDTSFPPVQGDGGNPWETATTGDIPAFNLNQAIQLIQMQIINFINIFNLPYTPEQLGEIVTLEQCGALLYPPFEGCASYHVMNFVFSQFSMNFTNEEKFIIWSELFPIWHKFEALIDEKGAAYAENAISVFIAANANPSFSIEWDDFIVKFDNVKNKLGSLNLSKNEIAFLILKDDIVNSIDSFLENTQLTLNEENDIASDHVDLLMSNPDYFEFTQDVSIIPPWMWVFFKEIAVELAIELIKKQFPNSNISQALVDALYDIEQNDWLGFVENVIKVAKDYNIALKIGKSIWDAGKLGYNAKKVWDVIKRMEDFGSEFIEDFIDAVQTVAGGIIGKIKWKSDSVGALMPNVDADQLIDKLGEFWGVTVGIAMGPQDERTLYPDPPISDYIQYVKIYTHSETTKKAGLPYCYTMKIQPQSSWVRPIKIRFCDL